MEKTIAQDIAHNAFNTAPFDACGYSPKYVAQKALRGKTHYVDDDTLRFHKSRVLACYSTDHGTVFTIIESCALDMHNSKRGFRFVSFDLAGEVLQRDTLDGCYKTRKQAESAMWDWLNSFDAVDHYKRKLKGMAIRESKRIEEMVKLADQLP